MLAGSLASVFAQSNVDATTINIFVVDDASPLDPTGDIADAGTPPAHITVTVLRRANGGPGAARNTGLQAATAGHDVVAFLDSDDTWRSDHLARAQLGLETGADLYFCDFSGQGHRDGHLRHTKFCGALRPGVKDAVPAVPHAHDIWTCDGAELAEWAVCEYLAQTSTIVYRVARLGGIRFTEHLRLAGEDHLFFLDLVLAARRVSFSLEREIERGAGVSVYDSARAWGDVRDLRRRIYNLGALKLMLARAAWSGPTKLLLDQRLAQSRKTVGFLLMRQMITSRRVPAEALSLVWRCDRRAAMLAPGYAAGFLFGRGTRFAEI